MDLYRLAEALQIIKSACKENEDCTICPMGSDMMACRVMRTQPEYWIIEQPEVQRVLKTPTFKKE